MINKVTENSNIYLKMCVYMCLMTFFIFFIYKYFFFKVNDFVRDKFMHKDGSVPLAAEILAGGCVSIFCRSLH